MTSYRIGRIAIFRSLLILTYSGHIIVRSLCLDTTIRLQIHHETLPSGVSDDRWDHLSSSCQSLAIVNALYHINLMILTMDMLHEVIDAICPLSDD